MNFDPSEVFSTLSSFLGSGYIAVIFIILLALSIIKKLMKIIGVAVLIGVIWIAANTYNIAVFG